VFDISEYELIEEDGPLYREMVRSPPTSLTEMGNGFDSSTKRRQKKWKKKDQKKSGGRYKLVSQG